VADDLKPVYLLLGSDRPKVERALRRLRVRVGEEAVEALSAVDSSGDDAVGACNSPGLLGAGPRLVLVDDVERWKAADAKAVVAYLADPAPDTVLALVAETVKRDAPLAKACAKAGDVLVYDVAKKDLTKWVAEQFARLHANADRDACLLLVELVGDDPQALSNEIEKLATWAGGDPIDTAAVEALAAPFAEPPVYDLTDAWGGRDLAATLAACESILERGSKPRRDEVPRIVATFASHVQRVRECQVLAAEGASSREVAAKWKRHAFYVQKLFAQAGNFSSSELGDIVVRLAELDLAVKGKSRVAPDLELERALVETGSKT
jgi:DNA polymerase III delta subunit